MRSDRVGCTCPHVRHHAWAWADTIGVVLACVLVGIAWLQSARAFAQAPLQSPRAADDARLDEQRAIDRLKATSAARVENGLPATPLGTWLEQVLGGPLAWESNDCGEGPRETAVPWCVQIDAPRGTMLMIAVGDSARGLTGRPQLFWGTMKLFDVDREVRRLGDLPRLVKESDQRRARFRDHPLRKLRADEAIPSARSVLVNVLEPARPPVSFEAWLTSLMPEGSKFAWTLEPCGGRETEPQCVWAKSDWPDGSRTLVALDLEMVQRGLGGPSLATASLYDRRRARIDRFTSLCAFVAAVDVARRASAPR